MSPGPGTGRGEPDGWAFEGAYRLLSYGFLVRSTSAASGELLRRVLGGAQGPVGRDLPSYALVERGPEARRPFSVLLDGRPIVESATPCAAFRGLLRRVVRETVRSTRDLVLVRAGAVSCGPVGLLLPASPRAGKSTLVAGLVRGGFSFLTDDLAALDPRSGRMIPFPLPLWIKRGSLGLLPDLDPRLPARLSRFLEGEWPVAADQVRPGAGGGPVGVAHVVFPRWEGVGEDALEPLPAGQGFADLVQHGLNLEALGPAAVAGLASSMEGVGYHRLRVRRLPRAVRLLRLLVAGRAARAPAGRSDGPLGESGPFPERLLVAPVAGRLRRTRAEGRGVAAGEVIGRVDGEREVLLVSPVAGTLLGWMAAEGEPVSPGRPVARLGAGEG